MRKRLIYRCDDVGYSPAYDLGIFEVLNSGIGCSADVMFDACDAAEALKKLKDMPWLSVGWHRHLWERPVLDPKEVPSLVDENGRFKWGHRKNHLMKEATYEDAYKEFEAEMKLCYDNLGRYPDVAGVRDDDIPLEKAFKDICDKYNITYGFFTAVHPRPLKIGEKSDGPDRKPTVAMEKWADKNIISCPIQVGGGFDMKRLDEYDPLIPMTNLKWTDKEEIYFYGWHPGYLDLHILNESTCSIHRVMENRAALSEEYKNWIIDNHVELINFRDDLYGTNELQDHLKAINSPLWVGNMK